jgi:hypothetical protein
MAEPAAGITRATSFGEREPPASRSKQKGKAPVKVAALTVAPEGSLPAEPAEVEEDEKHELDTLA